MIQEDGIGFVYGGHVSAPTNTYYLQKTACKLGRAATTNR